MQSHLDCRYKIEVIDLLKNPQLAKDHQIIAVPTLIRKLPTPVKKIIGNLSNTEKVLVGLDLQEGVTDVAAAKEGTRRQNTGER